MRVGDLSTRWQPGMTDLQRGGIEQHRPDRFGRAAFTEACPSPRSRRSPSRTGAAVAPPAGGDGFGTVAPISASTRRRQRQRDVGDAERIGDRIGDAHRRRHAIAFADALCAERRERRRRLHVDDQRLRHLGGGRQQIVGERSRQKAAVLGVGKFLKERRAERLAQSRRGSGRRPCRDAACVPQSCMVT